MSRHIHFIGIGGIGMSGVARLLLLKGEKVSGSDLNESAATQGLSSLGAQIYIGHNSNNIQDADLVVYSSAIDSQNAELVSAIERQIPVIKRAQMLSDLMDGKISITVSGAHGKTTTTSMISHVLTDGGLCPTVVAGGMLENYCQSSWLGEGKYFVAELDESDGSFLFFHPRISVATNIDYEHLDYYGNWHNIIDAYQRFINQTDKDGLIIGCGDDKNILEILKYANSKYITFGLSEENEVYAKDIRMANLIVQFKCVYKKNELGEVTLNIPGIHNISNSLACICVAKELGMDFEMIRQSLSEFRGVKRRFQIKSKINGIVIVEDYGHHPTEILATLKAAKTGNYQRVVVIFQPHRYSRTKFLMDEFTKCFDLSDYLIITDIYAASEVPITGVSARNIFEGIKALGKKDVSFIAKNDIIEHLLGVVRRGDLVLFLGAGDINRLSDELAQRINKNC
ncbi:MAG: UDP-N-acetylmuramate--L-alanine ligase [Candidatus Omnitrophota bacterium]|nr:UDP-N-acetylmuramate--L-alanine ligase [Candidatus Omnitrophota bacterium]